MRKMSNYSKAKHFLSGHARQIPELKCNHYMATVNLRHENIPPTHSFSPSVWGPSFWLVLHNGAAHYPENPSKIVMERMKGFIRGLQYMIPCENCSNHAMAYVDSLWKDIDEIVSSKQNLFNFYVNFHNKVNARYGKPILTHEQAWEMYRPRLTTDRLVY